MKNTVRIVLLLVIVPWLFSCAVNPVTGKAEFMLLSDEDEIKMGQQTDPEIKRMYGVYTDHDLEVYVASLGNQMARISHRPNLNYEFKIMDSPAINAFAVPGGYVYLTRGILAYLDNESQLAGVIGHEIGHITARHSAQQYSKAQLAQVGLGLGAMVSENFAGLAQLAGQGLSLLFLKFSRDNERQADQLGVEYSSKVGFDAREMGHFFETLDRMQDDNKGGLPFFLTTHPNPENRVGAVKLAAEKWQKSLGLTDPKINRNSYLTMINGIVFGNDPRQGFVENNVFYHPGMQFMFPVPGGWQLSNLPSEVQMASQDKRAAIVFLPGSEATPKAEAKKFIAESQAAVFSSQDVVVNGFTGHALTSGVVTQSGTVKILSYFIKKDSYLFVFHGITSEQEFDSYQATFKQTMTGFKALRDSAKLGVQPDRIRLEKTSSKMSLSTALTQMGTAGSDLEKVALINGRELTDEIPANTYLKVIEKGR